MTSRSPRKRPITPAENSPASGRAADPLERLRGRVDAFLEALERAEYRALAGLSERPGLEAVYDAHATLFRGAVFAGVEPLPDGGPESRRRDYLREFLAIGIEGHRTRGLQDAILTAEAAAVAEVDGERIPYRKLPVRIRREPDRRRRAALEGARVTTVADTLNPLLEESLRRVHEVAGELLDAPYDSYCATLAGVDFDALGAETEALLESTAAPHEELLRYYARRFLPDVRREELRTHDLGRILHGADFNALFPSESIVERGRRFVGAMGLDLLAEGRIQLDLEERPTKSPRAFCSAIRVPEEVMLVLQPYGGHDDYATFLHELGHALHFAYVDPAQPMEFRRLGDNGVTEGFAIAFDHLMRLAPFLKRVVGVDRPGEFLRFAAFRELVLLRRYAAKFAYERSLHRHGASAARAAEYAERLTEATGFRAPAALYLDDVDPHFYCIRYLRAWMLAGTLHAVLRERYDEDWFLNPRTGPFLRELWALGQAEPAELLARERLGVERLSFEPLLEMVHAHV